MGIIEGLVILPVPALPVSSEPTHSPRPGGPAAAARAPIRIIVVEDHPVSQLVLEDQLAAIGRVRVETCEDASSAWLAWKREPAALLLTDLNLPGRDGLALVYAIRAEEARGGAEAPRVPVVAITASAGAKDLARCRAAGIDVVLLKPVGQRTLELILRRLLRWDAA